MSERFLLSGDLDHVLLESLKQLLAKTRKLQVKHGLIPGDVTETPLLTEDEFVAMLQTNPELALSTEPRTFKFSPGFNPLLYLSERISFLHPDRVNERREQRKLAQQRLQRRSLHAVVQLENMQILRVLAKARCAGVTLPLAFSTSSTSICLILSPLRLGKMVIAYALNEDFEDSVRVHLDVNSRSTIKYELKELRAEAEYFVRAHIQGIDEDLSQAPFFYVQRSVQPLCSKQPCILAGGRWMMGLLQFLTSTLNPTIGNPSTLCLIGSLYDQSVAVSREVLQIELESLVTRFQHTYFSNMLHRIYSPELAIAWNDLTAWSQLAVKEDERLMKKHAKELKKVRKGLVKSKSKGEEVPEIQFPELPTTVQALLQVE